MKNSRIQPAWAATVLTLTLHGQFAIAGNCSSGKKDIVQTAVQAGSFKTLAAALSAADLVESLQGPGPFTVFAPTDEAFAQLPNGTVETLLTPKNRKTLSRILTYHVVPGRVPASAVVNLAHVKTLNGQRFEITTSNGNVSVDDANVVKTDIECSNGIIHVIDAVIMPSDQNIVQTAKSAGAFSTLITALQAARLDDALGGEGPFTVFAPTDEAFAKLPTGTVESLLKPKNRKQLQAILKYHVVSGRIFADDAINAGRAATLEGTPVQVRLVGGRINVNDAGVINNDIDTANGVIHAIDTVLIPKAASAQTDGRKVIGVYVGHPSKTLESQLGLDPGTGLVVTGLTKKGPARQAGLMKYDVITAIDGHPATSKTLAMAKNNAGFGGQLELTVVRRGRPLSIHVPVVLE